MSTENIRLTPMKGSVAISRVRVPPEEHNTETPDCLGFYGWPLAVFEFHHRSVFEVLVLLASFM